jgi:hypothetical protein
LEGLAIRDVGIFYVDLEFLGPFGIFGIFYGHLVYFMAIWDIYFLEC